MITMKKLAMTAAVIALLLGSSSAIALADNTLTITNNGTRPAEYVYISSVDSSTWGPDWLGSDVLEPGQKVTYTITTGCMQDIKIQWQDGHTQESRSFNICQYDLLLNY